MNRFKEDEKEVIEKYFQMHNKYFSVTGDGLKPKNGGVSFEELPDFLEDKREIILPTIEELRKEIKANYVDGCADQSTYKVTITKSFAFDACHYLPYHDRRCKYLHGHTYHMDIALKGYVNKGTGMVMDYGNLKSIVNRVLLDDWDHGFINEQIAYPTAEIMVMYAWAKLMKDLPDLESIKIWETDGSCAELTRNDVMEFING